MEKAVGVVKMWKSTYPAVARMAQQLAQLPVIVNSAGRRIPTDPERSYANINYMVQSTARDIFVAAVRRIVDEFGVDSLWLFVHDEVILQVPEEDAEKVAQRVGELMTTVFFGVPIEADAEVVGIRWGKDE